MNASIFIRHFDTEGVKEDNCLLCEEYRSMLDTKMIRLLIQTDVMNRRKV